MNSLRLHLLMNPAALHDLLAQLTPLDKLVLLDRGVELLLQADALAGLLRSVDEVYCSRPDRLARGLPLISGAMDIDDDALVTLAVERGQILSWT